VQITGLKESIKGGVLWVESTVGNERDVVYPEGFPNGSVNEFFFVMTCPRQQTAANRTGGWDERDERTEQYQNPVGKGRICCLGVCGEWKIVKNANECGLRPRKPRRRGYTLRDALLGITVCQRGPLERYHR